MAYFSFRLFIAMRPIGLCAGELLNECRQSTQSTGRRDNFLCFQVFDVIINIFSANIYVFYRRRQMVISCLFLHIRCHTIVGMAYESWRYNA